MAAGKQIEGHGPPPTVARGRVGVSFKKRKGGRAGQRAAASLNARV